MSSTTTTFVYNGDGLRDSLTTGGVTTTSTWDIAGGLPVELYDGTLSYLYGAGRVSEIDGSGNTFYYLPDALGSTMALVDSSGTVADIYNGACPELRRRDAFGAVRSFSVSQANPFTFTGEQTDATTGLEYLRARYYDPATGSFISRDPVPGINRFAYAEGDPINFTDPSGMCLSKQSLGDLKALLDRLESHLGNDKIADIIRAAWEKSYASAVNLLCGAEKTVADAAKRCVESTTCTMAVLGALGAAGGFADLGMLGEDAAFGGEEAAGGFGDEIFPEIKTGSSGGETAGRAFPRSVKTGTLGENPDTCVFCHMKTESPQVDHAQPRSLGGNATPDNGQTACPWCNGSKGNRPFPVNPPPGYQGRWPPPWAPK